MTKKDYVLITRVLRDSRPFGDYDRSPEEYVILRKWKKICENFVCELLEDNTRFNANKFLTACNYY